MRSSLWGLRSAAFGTVVKIRCAASRGAAPSHDAVLSCPVPVLSCPVLSCPVLSCPACPVLTCPVLPVLSCPVLSCPACPALSCPVLSCPVLSCPVLPGLVVSGASLQIMLWGVLGDCPISWFFRKISCVVFYALSVHPPDFTSRCLHVRCLHVRCLHVRVCKTCHTVGILRKFPSIIPRIVFCINRTFRCLYVRHLVRSRFFFYGRKGS